MIGRREKKESIGILLYNWISKNFFIHRSLGGKGNIKFLNSLKQINKKLKIKKFKSGSNVYDWKVPSVWELNRSYIKHSSGKIYADSRESNINIVQYSIPVKTKLTKNQLLKKIYSLPKQPNLVPYVTSYYKKDWGFCMKHSEKKKLPNGYYSVFIDSVFKKDGLPYGELYIKGKTKKEILFSTYICHPSMANNELSGPAVSIFLSKFIEKNFKNNYYSYRFIYIPETIGSIAYIKKNLKNLKKNVFCAFNLTCVGDERMISMVKSRKADAISDFALESLLINEKNKKIFSFLDRGSDERQFCSPGVDIDMSVFCRSKFGEYKEYHTSADNLNLVSPKGLEVSIKKLEKMVEVFEIGIFPKTNNLCEPHLTKYNLYESLSIKTSYKLNFNKKILDFLAYSDGKKNVFELAVLLNIKIEDLLKILKILLEKKLILIKYK